MTTIAYKDGIVAYDSRAVKGDIIIDDEFDKCEEFNNHYFFYSGDPCDLEMFINAFFDVERNMDVIPNCEVIVVDDKGNVWNCSVNDENILWKFKVKEDKIMAIGSGISHALTAMDCGCSAEEAVKMAAKRDVNTGGEIRIFKVSRE